MKRIVFDIKNRESSEIFDELRNLFKEEDYTAATTNFDSNRNPRTLVILTHNDAVETYLSLKYFGRSGTKFLELATEEEKSKFSFMCGFYSAMLVDRKDYEEKLKTMYGIDLECELMNEYYGEFKKSFPNLDMTDLF